MFISGVTRLSSSQDIRQAYRRIALTSHPDKVDADQREEATKKFQDVQIAYDVLQDPARKKQYDLETFGFPQIQTPPRSFDDERPQSWSYSMPLTPDSPYRPEREKSFFRSPRYSTFDIRADEPHFMTFDEAAIMFHPEDRRHFWLCNDEDDPAELGGHQLIKRLYVSMQEYVSV
jgi:curved DNA-binding protein CbpA